MKISISFMVGAFLFTTTGTFATPVKKEKLSPTVKLIATKGKNVEWLNASKNLRGKMILGVGLMTRRRWQIITWGSQGRVPKSKKISNVISGFGSGLPLWSPQGNRFRIASFGIKNDYSNSIGIFKTSGQRETSIGPGVYATWGAFSPLGTRFARVGGSTHVVGSGRIGEDYSLRVWNGSSETQLPVGPSFLDRDKGEVYVSWRDENELLVTQESSRQMPLSMLQTNIESMKVDGKSKPSIWLHNAWMPLVSPDKKWVAFYGPAIEKLASENSLDRMLYVARYDKKPLRNKLLKYSERRLLGQFELTIPSVFWTPDSQFLITAQRLVGNRSPSRIQRIRTSDGRREVLADLHYARPRHDKPVNNDSVSWKFDGLSRDGKFLYLTFNQSSVDSRYMHKTAQWFRFGLSNRKLEKLAVFRDSDFSWYDESQS